ncbi:MAG: hypothetical protein AAFQ34_15410 [Pseudomonadota bacterium]
MDGEATGNLSARAFTSRVMLEASCHFDGTATTIGISMRIPLRLYQSAMPIPGGRHRLSITLPAPGANTASFVIAPDPPADHVKDMAITNAVLYVADVTPQVVPMYGPPRSHVSIQL